MAKITGRLTAAAAAAGRFAKKQALWILALLVPLGFVLVPPVRDFLNQNSPAIVAAFTAVLAFSTIALWKATGQSVELARRVATELERPYVYAMPLQHTLDEYFSGSSKTASVTVRLKNIGRGPARVRHCICSAGLVRSEDERPGSQHRWDVRSSRWGRETTWFMNSI